MGGLGDRRTEIDDQMTSVPIDVTGTGIRHLRLEGPQLVQEEYLPLRAGKPGGGDEVLASHPQPDGDTFTVSANVVVDLHLDPMNDARHLRPEVLDRTLYLLLLVRRFCADTTLVLPARRLTAKSHDMYSLVGGGD